MTTNCPKCGAENPERSNFCQNCAYSFAQADIPVPTPLMAKKTYLLPRPSVVVIVLVLVAVAVLGSFLSSLALLSVHESQRTIVVEPQSHYAIRFEFYGIGLLEYSDRQSGGPQIYLLEMNEWNYERFVSGKSYHYTGYSTLSSFPGGRALETGTMWVVCLVFVNDNLSPATVEFGSHMTVYFSLLVAGPIAAAVMVIALIFLYVVPRLSKGEKQLGKSPERRK
jgi:hypothetical protein